MSEPFSAAPNSLPSSGRLARSTAIAAAAAALILVTVVMPAEYGVDPTRIGRMLGLTEMGEIKVQLAKENAIAEAADRAVPNTPESQQRSISAQPSAPAPGPSAVPASADKSEQTTVTLLPNEGKEIKLAMLKGGRVNYTWSTDRGVVNYDTHADRTAAPAIKYHGYAKGQGKASDTGVLTAAFDGMHGWFWRNRTSDPLTLTMKVTGQYSELKRVK